MAELFESYERRLPQINAKLAEYGIASIEEAEKITKDAGLDVYHLIEGIQPICFENAKWAYTVGAAIAIKKNCRRAADAAAAIGEGLQALKRTQSASHSSQVTSHSQLQRALSVSLRRLTEFVRSPSELSLTVLERTLQRSSPESTASHMLRQSMTIRQASSRSSPEHAIQRILHPREQRLTAMVQMTFRKV